MLFQFNANQQQVQLPPLFRAPTWHFRGVASSLLGPHQTGARVTTINLTPPHPPMTDPMTPLTLLETIAPAGDFRAVWRAPSRAHTRASWLSRPTLVSQPIEFTWSQAVRADPQSGGSSRPGNVGGTSACQFEPRTRRRQWWWRRKRRRR